MIECRKCVWFYEGEREKGREIKRERDKYRKVIARLIRFSFIWVHTYGSDCCSDFWQQFMMPVINTKSLC